MSVKTEPHTSLPRKQHYWIFATSPLNAFKIVSIIIPSCAITMIPLQKANYHSCKCNILYAIDKLFCLFLFHSYHQRFPSGFPFPENTWIIHSYTSHFFHKSYYHYNHSDYKSEEHQLLTNCHFLIKTQYPYSFLFP